MEQIRCFAEKEKIVIGSSGGDISIPGLNKKLLLFGNFLYAEGKEEVFLEGKPVKEKAEITPGDRLRIKELTITFFKESLTIEGETESYQCTLRELPCREVPFEGFPYYKKSPRIFRQTGSEKITVKEPPKKEVMSKSSLAQMIIPPLLMVAVTAFIGIYMKRGLYVIASICMSIVTTIFSIQRFFSEKKELKQKNDKREEVYYDYLAGLRRLIRRKRQEERETLNFKAPEIHELQRMVTEYDSRLYERSPEDEDFLQVSLGFRSGESMIKVEYNRDELRTDEDELVDEAEQLFHDFEMIRHIPVTVNLRRTHLGIVGEREYLHNQIKYLLAQICFFKVTMIFKLYLSGMQRMRKYSLICAGIHTLEYRQ